MCSPVTFAVLAAFALGGCGRLFFDPLGSGDAPIPTPAFIQAAGGRTMSGTTVSAAFDSDVTAGNTVIVELNTNKVTTSVGDTLGTTYTICDSTFIANARETFAYGRMPTSGPVTVTAAVGTTDYLEVRVLEFSGIAVDAYDQIVGGMGTPVAAGPYLGPMITTTSPNELVVAIALSSPGWTTVGPGFTEATNFINDESEYTVVPTPTTVTTTAVLDRVTDWWISAATFRAGP